MPRDPIEKARQEREAVEALERARIRRHPGAEPSDRPMPPHRLQSADAWPGAQPIQGRPGDGNPHVEPPPQRNLEATKQAFLGVWGIIAVIFGAAAAGWTVHAFFAKPLIAETVKDELKPVLMQLVELKQSQETNQRATETSFAGLSKDIEWLKREQKIEQSPPIKGKR